MQGSSCPTCGWVLRWLPEQSAWGCDRCRKIVAAGSPPPGAPPPGPAGFAPPGPPPGPPPGAPQPHAGPPSGPSPYAPHGGPQPAPYSPHGHAPGPHGHPPPGYAMPPPRGKSSKGLFIGLGVAAAAAAGIIIAVVASKGGGGGGAGHGSREDLVKSALAALSAGDVDKLVKMSDPLEQEKRFLDCSERDKDKAKAKAKDTDKDQDADGGDEDKDKDKDKDADDSADEADDPQMRAKRMRRQFEKLAEKTKGMTLELVSVSDPADKKDKDDDKDFVGQRMKKGDKATKGCVLKVDVAFHQLTAKVKVTEKDAKESSETESKLVAFETGGSWYLVAPPEISGGGALIAKARKFRDDICACKDSPCTDELEKEARDWERENKSDLEKVSSDDRKALRDLEKEAVACQRKLKEGDKAAMMKEALTKFEDFKRSMCSCMDKACADKVQEELLEWSKATADKYRDVKPEPSDEKRMTEIMKDYTECSTKIMAAGATDDPPPPDTDDPPPPEEEDKPDHGSKTAASLASIPACGQYRKQIDRLRSCPKIPRASAETIRKGYSDLEKSWATVRSSAGARDSMSKACQSIVDALKKSFERMCP